jgi:4-hydroxy-2-oxoheptanedioate aldolase
MAILKKLIYEDRIVAGLTMQHVCNPWLAQLYSLAGSDFVFAEYEHCFYNEASLADFVLVCKMKGMPVVAKIPELTRTSIAKLLECGVTGIQYPGISSREEAEKLVSLIKFPPRGIRAVDPGLASNDYQLDSDPREFLRRSDEETVALVHIETRAGVENIDEILSVDGIDMMFLGMYDFSVSFGHPGEFTHPDVVKNVEICLESARRNNVATGAWVPDYDGAKPWIERGVKFFETATEVEMIFTGAKETIAEFRAGG